MLAGKKIAGTVCACALALCLAGCTTGGSAESEGAAGEGAAGSETPAATAVDSSTAQPVTLEESGWWAKDGYVHYGVTVANPNDDLGAANTALRVTLFDGNGEVASEQTDEIALVGPGARTGFAGTAGDGWAPAAVTFELVEGSTVWESAEDYQEPLLIENFEEEDKLYFRYEVTGQIANLTDDYLGTASLSILLRDDAGSIVAGYTGAAYRIKAGRTKDFLVTMHSAPDHAATEVYAQPR